MEQRETQKQLLERMVSAGQLTREAADEIRHAPEWSVTALELLSYLAGIITLSGIVRVIALAFKDASQLAIGSALVVTGMLCGAGAWKLPKRNDVLARLAEVVEGGSLLLMGSGTGVLLAHTSINPKLIAVVIAAPVIAWGYWRSTIALFVGSLALCVGVPLLAFPLGAMITDGTRMMGAVALASGAALWMLGQRRVGTAFIQRAAGCYFLLMGAFVLGAELGGPGKVIPIIVGAGLFGLGSMNLQLEALGAGALAVTIGVAMATSDWLPSEFTRGITTIVVGAAMFLAVGAQLRRAKQEGTSRGGAHHPPQSTSA
jgi:hypothetical protein